MILQLEVQLWHIYIFQIMFYSNSKALL